MIRAINILLLAFLMLVMQGCFTGVESTKAITEKDVRRAEQELDKGRSSSSLPVFADSLPSWREGKGFWVVDNQARLIFRPSVDYDIDSLDIEGKQLTYDGYGIHRRVDNSEEVEIYLKLGTYRLVYDTGRTLQDVKSSSFSIPFLVDDDMLQFLAKQLKSKTVYVKTPIWYDIENSGLMNGRRFVPVEILAVKPGNRVYPVKMEFRAADNGDRAFVWMKLPGTYGAGRDFDSMFSMTDVRKQYPNISDPNWSNIVHCKVAEGMTKQECSLAMGNPVNVRQLPDQTGLREYWYYDGGRYLFFVDGVLKDFR